MDIFKRKDVYVVVNKETGHWEEYQTRQQAWEAWQRKWMRTEGLKEMDRWTFGKRKNMKKYMKK